MPRTLIVAATELELCAHEGLVCGIGPVEAASATARALALERPDTVVHLGVAGGRRIAPGSLVIGSEAVYCDLSAEVPIMTRVHADEKLLAIAHDAVPDAILMPIGTSAAVDGPCGAQPDIRVEGMEGFAVLRACELAGVPAIELRAISNQIGEGDRELWQVRRGLDSLRAALPPLVEAIEAAYVA